MCCLISILLLIGPRAAALVWALTDSVRWQGTFENFVLPCLGIVFLPWTLLAYVLVSPNGVDGFDWAWLVIAFLIDMGSLSSGEVNRRRRNN